MFLAVRHIVWPVTRVDRIVVEQGEGALLDGGCAVPAMPVPGARGGVREHTILPLTVVTGDWLFC